MRRAETCSPESFKPLVERVLAEIVEAHHREVEALRSRLESLSAQQPSSDRSRSHPEAFGKALVVQDVEELQIPSDNLSGSPEPVCKDASPAEKQFTTSLPGTPADENATWKEATGKNDQSPSSPGLRQLGSRLSLGSRSTEALGHTDEQVRASKALQEARETGLLSAESKHLKSASKSTGVKLWKKDWASSRSRLSGSSSSGSLGHSTTVSWQWLHKTGWRDYKEQETAQLETTFQGGNSKARLKSGKQGHHPMEIFFVDMLQHDCASRKVRSVRRLGPDPWWQRLRRFSLSMYRSWETGKPRMESFGDFYCSDIQLHHVRDDSGNVFDPTGRDGPEMERGNMRASGCKMIVDSAVFQRFTMLMIMMNAIWIAIETDTNDAENLFDADLIFIVVENFFCAVFTLEMIVRFMSYARKRDAFFDAMFMFDFLCTVSMIVEIWLILLVSFFLTGQQGSTNTSLGLFRLARLLRVTRISRLVRIIPEFVTLLKGLSRSLKPVMVSTFLLTTLVMLFAIVFRSQVKGTRLGQCCRTEELCEACDGYFYSIPETVLTLFFNGTLLDSVKLVADTIRKENPFLSIVFTLYIFVTNCAMLNMLIGILCGVVAEVKEKETERMDKFSLMSRLSDIMAIYDRDGDNMLNKSEFDLLITNPEVKHVLTEFHVDAWNLRAVMDDYAASLSEDSHGAFNGDPSFPFDEILDIVLRLRGGGGASVSDIVSLRRFAGQRFDNVESKVLELHQTESRARH